MTDLFFLFVFTGAIGHLFLPLPILTFWVVIGFYAFVKNFSLVKFDRISLFLIIFPAYSILLSIYNFLFNGRLGQFPYSHCVSIFIPFVLYSSSLVLLRSRPFSSLFRAGYISYIFLVSLGVFEYFFTRFSFTLPSFIIGSSGFTLFISVVGRLSGSYTEPGHFGLALNFFLPFFLAYYRFLSPVFKYFWLFILFVPTPFVLLFVGSPITSFLHLLSVTFWLFDKYIFYSFYLFARFFALLTSLSSTKIRSLRYIFLSSLIILLFICLAYFVLPLSASFIARFNSLYAVLFSLDFSNFEYLDKLSGLDRAYKILWALALIVRNPFGLGIAPFYKQPAQFNPSADSIDTFFTDSSLSLPLDVGIFGGIFFVCLYFVYFLSLAIRLYPALYAEFCSLFLSPSSPRFSSESFSYYTSLKCLVLVLSVVFFRYLFLPNYWFMFLPLALAFSSSLFLRYRSRL